MAVVHLGDFDIVFRAEDFRGLADELKEQVDAITFTPEYRKQIAKSWGIWDVIGTLGVVACCAAFYWYFF